MSKVLIIGIAAMALCGCNRNEFYSWNREVGVEAYDWFKNWNWVTSPGMPIIAREQMPDKDGVYWFYVHNL